MVSWNKRQVRNMTIRKRLYLSNILMILVPVCIALLISAGCVGGMWLAVKSGGGLTVDDSEDFYRLSAGIAEMAEQSLSADGAEQAHLDELTALLDENAVSLSIMQNGVPVYHYGTQTADDTQLIAAADTLGGEARLSNGRRSLFAHTVEKHGAAYRILLLGSVQAVSYTSLKVAAVLAVLVLLCAVLAAILLTNRFLTRFVIRRVTGPLDLLADGVREIRDGNLEHRIEYDSDDEFASVCAAFNEMAERLAASVEQSLRHEQSRKELLAGISHDLRSPLTSIRAYVEGLLDGVARTPEMQRRYLQTVRTKAEDIDRMVSQLFLFSKMELDEYPVHPQHLRLDEAVQELVCTAETDHPDLTVTADTVPAAVCADPDELRRILRNIADNSRKYKVKPVGMLHISLKTTENDCILSLTDDGPGVPPAVCGKLFDVFYRSDPARRNPAGGSGLGLAIAAKAVQRMGGTIRAENAETGGLRIIITLPKEETGHAEDSDR